MVGVDAAVQGASEPAFEQGHTAGLTQEAPIGNNNELDPGSFDAHVRSISDTWLCFAVGSGYAYSNLGTDLAGYILERVEDKPFAAVMRDSLLGPLGMDRSTFDRTVIRSTSDRAVGHADPYPEPPVEVPMTAAGGLYSSAADLARFLAFLLNDGSIDGRMLLDPKSIEEQRTVPAPYPDAHPSPTRWRVHGSSATPSCPSSLQHLNTWQENLSTAFSVRQPVCGHLADFWENGR